MRFVVVIIMIFVSMNAHGAIVILNGSFEDTSVLPFEIPTAPGYWAGDICEVVEEENGIVPLDGSHMVKFINTTRYGPSPSSVESQLYQFVDLGDYQEYIATGSTEISVSFYVNRIPGDSGTDTEFKIGIDAFIGSPSNYPNSNYTTRTDSVITSLISDSDITTWEKVQADLIIPSGSEYLCIIISAVENKYNDGIMIEFDGHYGDQVELSVVLPIAVEKSSWGMIKSLVNSCP